MRNDLKKTLKFLLFFNGVYCRVGSIIIRVVHIFYLCYTVHPSSGIAGIFLSQSSLSLHIEADLNGIGILAVLSGAECPAHCVIERRDNMMDSNSAKRVDFEIKGGQLLIGLRDAGMVG